MLAFHWGVEKDGHWSPAYLPSWSIINHHHHHHHYQIGTSVASVQVGGDILKPITNYAIQGTVPHIAFLLLENGGHVQFFLSWAWNPEKHDPAGLNWATLDALQSTPNHGDESLKKRLLEPCLKILKTWPIRMVEWDCLKIGCPNMWWLIIYSRQDGSPISRHAKK